jgi:dipeptidyl aminopeptidase/acylaminoacyl peptidase
MRYRWHLGTALFATIASPAAAQQSQVTRSFLPHPHDSTKRIEYFIAKPADSGPWPVLLFVHGHQEGDRPGAAFYKSQGTLQQMAERGIVGVAVSQPGYGQSDGPPDFAGPRTQAAIVTVIDHLRRQPFVIADRVGLYGYSRGAIAVSMVATQVRDLAVLILGAGIYDMADAYKRLDRSVPQLDGLARNVEREAGTSREAFLQRSALPNAPRITAATLLLHGARDDRSPIGGAQQLAEALRGGGVPVTLEIFPDAAHSIPAESRVAPINSFIERWLISR